MIDPETGAVMKLFRPYVIVAGVVLCAAAFPAAAGATSLERAFADGRTDLLLDAAQAPRWTTVRDRFAREAAAPRKLACKTPGKSKASCAAVSFTQTLATWRDHSRAEQLAGVNRAINALPYVADMENWGQADHWETPAEMFARGGDCEGFALTKYFALRELGFAEDALRIAVVWDSVDLEEHAVLLVRLDGRTFVLDNKTEEAEPMDAAAARYRLLYYAGNSGVRLPVPAASSSRSLARARLINGGRTLVLRVEPRRPGRTRATPAPDISVIQPAGD